MAFKGSLITEVREKGVVATMRGRIEKLGIPLPKILEAARARKVTRIKTY